MSTRHSTVQPDSTRGEATSRSRQPVRDGEKLPYHVDHQRWSRLVNLDHSEPHALLGAHPAVWKGEQGVVLRAFHPDAVGVEALLPDEVSRALPVEPSQCQDQEAGVRRQEGKRPKAETSRSQNVGTSAAWHARRLEPIEEGGLFGTFLPGAELPLMYRLRYHFSDGATWECVDPYRFAPTLGDVDLHLFNEGNHRRVWEKLGAHPMRMDGIDGVAFAVWAPSARRVSVTGDFCRWDGRIYPMRQMGSSGVFELFIPDLKPGMHYKYEIKTADGHIRLKSDPYAQAMEGPPNNASLIFASSHVWGDGDWMESRPKRDIIREPVAVYELHLGSWARVPEEGNRPLTYREIAPLLVAHVKRFGFTHVELMPVAEHPLGASWGYQVTGYYAPTWRYGNPDDFRYFVDVCHQNGIGVIMDWVPAHFPKDDFALRRFDGTALYEHEDPRQGEHPDWGTLIFNYGRKEVRNFLLANALYWLKEFHLDGLRVDAVASMLYLDYSRKEGEWLPNQYGGKENIGALELLRAVNEAIRTDCPGCFTVAEESTAFSGVTRSVQEHGLGFTFKWNMGWMHDTLLYFTKEPVHRKYHQNDLTFAMLYEWTERFINAISHDEVVHGKRALFEKMPGDIWQKFANLRLLLAYQYTRPGKKLLFMGTELAMYNEWYYDASLDWHLADEPMRKGLALFLEDLGRLYVQTPCLWRTDGDPFSFAWIDCSDCENSVVSYRRQDGEETVVVVLNLTPVPRGNYRIGAPVPGRYAYLLSSDYHAYGGSGYPTPATLHTEPVGAHGFGQSLNLTVPPLSALVLKPAP